jgi:subtilase family serine protease
MPAGSLRRSIVCAAFFFSSIHAQAQPARQTLHGHVRPVVSSGQATAKGVLPPDKRLNLSLVLPLRNITELAALLRRLYDPSSSDYRRFLSVAQFTDRFSPSAEDYQAVVDFARANGFAVTDTPANRLLVPISGTVEQIENAFHVMMKVYPHPTEPRDFFSPDREASLDLAVPVAHIAGLNDFSPPRLLVTKALPGFNTPSGSGPGGSYLGSDMRAAYYGRDGGLGQAPQDGICPAGDPANVIPAGIVV